MPKKKYELFVEVFKKWTKKYKLKVNDIRRDNRIDSRAAWDENTKILTYNTRRLAQYPWFIVISDALHEIGHLKNKLPYETKQEKIIAEYEAELFALNVMRKHYPKEYKKTINRVGRRLRNKAYWKDVPMYCEAFMRIKEYRNIMLKKDKIKWNEIK